MPTRRIKAVIEEMHRGADSHDINTYTPALDAIAAAMEAERLSMKKSVSEYADSFRKGAQNPDRKRSRQAATIKPKPTVAVA